MAYPYVYNTPTVPMYGGYVQPAYTAPMPQQPQAPTQSQPQQQQQPQPDQLINGGYVVVPSEDDVNKYPVAPGNLVTFKIENEPVIIEKSMGRSQFAAPEYRYFRLSEFNKDDKSKGETQIADDDLKNSIKHIEKRLESLGDSYVELKKLLSKKQSVKKEDGNE